MSRTVEKNVTHIIAHNRHSDRQYIHSLPSAAADATFKEK